MARYEEQYDTELPQAWEYDNQVLTTQEAIQEVENKLGAHCGDLDLDLAYLFAIRKLERVSYSSDREELHQILKGQWK